MGNVSMQQQSPDEVTDEEVHTLIPAIPSSFPQLESMTMSQVKDLLDNESSFEDFIQQTSEVATLNELKQSIMSANVDAAEANLLHREKVERQTAELDSLGDDLQMKLEQFNKLDQERVALTSPPDLNATIKYLNHVKKEAYRQSEAIADDWVESGGDVGDFVKKFMEKRALYHTRAAKAERLSMSM
jgi:hypothetical protein